MKLLMIALLFSISSTLFALTPEQRGLEIAREAEHRDAGFGDSRADMEMRLYNRNGDVSERQLKIKSLEVQNDGDKTLTIFDTPRDVKGTVFLNHTHATKADDQWLYLPALKRVKRISSRNKSGPFMGSEFAYEDLGSQEVEKYTYKYVKDEKVNGYDTMVIERYPVYKHSGYTKQIVWIDKNMYQAVKIEFYDRKKALLKTLTFKNFNQYLNHYWRPGKMEMVNHQTGKKTILSWHNYQFKTGLKDRDFHRSVLKRMR